ncbi:MAG TPA: ABC transporter ATP-binding protein [Clostridiales bacterium UBA8960]|jgi:ABC-2 type transport system ATP-binding protein|nr:ABC transporter ATP-binding protein [Clostridiales bacterium UBA8960]
MIEVSKLTLTYPSGKGVFDLNFKISEGKVTGYLGPNGAGKTTTIRAIMGFMAPNSGLCKVNGLDCVKQAPEIQRILGYVPGEIAFLDGMKGQEFLKFLSQMRGTNNKKYVDELFERFDVDPTGKIKKLSKGNKQKLAIIAAFMHDPKVLVLDEPTSGLDPLMQKRFVELIKDEKKKGKTILMSSHIFEEVEKTCDDVIIIRDGRIVHASDVASLSKASVVRYHVGVSDVDVARGVLSTDYAVTSAGDALEVMVPKEKVDAFVKALAGMEVLQLESKAQTLEDLFMQYYNKEVAQ